jgi:predicted AAA+ superfamily ATPase
VSIFVERSLGDVLLKGCRPVSRGHPHRPSAVWEKNSYQEAVQGLARYVNLKDPGLIEFAQSDAKGFLSTYPSRKIIDESQRYPQILSHIQSVVEADRFTGRYILTGSYNLLLLKQVSQSLAGRTSIRNLFPLSYAKLSAARRSSSDLHENPLLGGYPIVNLTPEILTVWLDSYMLTYVERDVRLIKNVSDLSQFRRFLGVIAGRVGQLVDLSGI